MGDKNMLKYLKYISLTILITLIVYVSFLYINYSKTNNNESHVQDIVNVSEKYDLLGNQWFFDKILIYNGDKLLNETDVNGNSYIFLDDASIDYCSSSNGDCVTGEYIYIDDKLTVPFDILFAKGEYDVFIQENILKLSKNNGDRTTVYVFVTYLG